MFKIREAPATHITSEVLVERVGLRVIRLELPAGASLPSHYAARDVALICVRGYGRVSVNQRVVPVDVGGVVGLLPGENHGVFADSALGVIVVQGPSDALHRLEPAQLAQPWIVQGS